MKTITLKADEQFDAALTKLAEKTHSTKSAVIRTAVLNYKKYLEREALRQQVSDASLKIRSEATRIAADLEAANADGL